VASWLIFRVAHSLRIDFDMLVIRALKINQLTDGGMPPTYDSMHEAKRPALHFSSCQKGPHFCFSGRAQTGTVRLLFALTKLVTIHPL